MAQQVIFVGLLCVVVPTLGGEYPWMSMRKTSYFSIPTSKIDKLHEFLLCTGWKKADFNSKEDTMYLALLTNHAFDMPVISISMYGKERTIKFEFGKPFKDTLLSGKKATALINLKQSPKSPNILLFDIAEELEEDDGGVVVTHKMEIDTEAPPPHPPKSYAIQGKSKCKDIEIFTGWYWTQRNFNAND